MFTQEIKVVRKISEITDQLKELVDDMYCAAECMLNATAAMGDEFYDVDACIKEMGKLERELAQSIAKFDNIAVRLILERGKLGCPPLRGHWHLES